MMKPWNFAKKASHRVTSTVCCLISYFQYPQKPSLLAAPKFPVTFKSADVDPISLFDTPVLQVDIFHLKYISDFPNFSKKNWKKHCESQAGWWFGTLLFFPYWECHQPN